MLYRETIAICSQIHTKHMNTLCGQNVELYIKTQSVPRSKHPPVSVIKTSHLIMYREIIVYFSWDPYKTHKNTVCAERIILTLRRLMSYIYGAPILDVSRSHTTTQHSR